LYSLRFFVISEHFDLNSRPISSSEICRKQDFRVFHVVAFNKAADESKNDGFPNAAICNSSALP